MERQHARPIFADLALSRHIEHWSMRAQGWQHDGTRGTAPLQQWQSRHSQYASGSDQFQRMQRVSFCSWKWQTRPPCVISYFWRMSEIK